MTGGGAAYGNNNRNDGLNGQQIEGSLSVNAGEILQTNLPQGEEAGQRDYAIHEIQKTLADASSRLPSLEKATEQLDAQGKIEITFAQLQALTEDIKTIERLVEMLKPNHVTYIRDVNTEPFPLSQKTFDFITSKGVHTCEDLSKQDYFYEGYGIAGWRGNRRQEVNLFLRARGYPPLTSIVDNYDEALFENSPVKPEDELPQLIKHDQKQLWANLLFIREKGVTTYGQLTMLTTKDLRLNEKRIEIVVEHLKKLGLHLRDDTPGE